MLAACERGRGAEGGHGEVDFGKDIFSNMCTFDWPMLLSHSSISQTPNLHNRLLPGILENEVCWRKIVCGGGMGVVEDYMIVARMHFKYNSLIVFRALRDPKSKFLKDLPPKEQARTG